MARFFVGIDIAKLRHQVAIIDDQGEPRGKSFSILNSADGFALLTARLSELGPPSDFLVGMEATGPYGWPLQYRLTAMAYRVAVLNPLQTAAFARRGIRKTKTDPIDAKGIAELLRFGKFSPAIIPDERALRLRELTRYRHIVVGLLNRFTNLLGSRLYRTFPEFAGRFPMLWLPTPLGILAKHPLPVDVMGVPLEELTRRVRLLSHGRLGQKVAAELQQAARSTIGIPLAGDVYALQIRGIVTVVRTLQVHLRGLTQRISRVLHEVPQPLTSIPGVADLSAAALLGEIVDVRLFDHPKKLVAFAGLDPSTFQTGQFQGDHAHISKRGSPPLRRAVWQAAFAALRHNPELRVYYQKKRQQGKHHKVALGATARKLLHVVWRLLTDNRLYEERPMPH